MRSWNIHPIRHWIRDSEEQRWKWWLHLWISHWGLYHYEIRNGDSTHPKRKIQKHNPEESFNASQSLITFSLLDSSAVCGLYAFGIQLFCFVLNRISSLLTLTSTQETSIVIVIWKENWGCDSKLELGKAYHICGNWDSLKYTCKVCLGTPTLIP